MTYATDRPRKDVALRVTEIGSYVIRYGLALVIGWIGLMKFTGYEDDLGCDRERVGAAGG
jgi:hypothetical protein